MRIFFFICRKHFPFISTSLDTCLPLKNRLQYFQKIREMLRGKSDPEDFFFFSFSFEKKKNLFMLTGYHNVFVDAYLFYQRCIQFESYIFLFSWWCQSRSMAQTSRPSFLDHSDPVLFKQDTQPYFEFIIFIFLNLIYRIPLAKKNTKNFMNTNF